MKAISPFLGGLAVAGLGTLLFLYTPDEALFVRPSSPETFPRVTILFGGDLMFDRSIRTAMEANGDDHVFSCITDVLQGADIVVANLEGPITSQVSQSVGTAVGGEGNYTFTFPTSTAPLLARHNIRLVNIGNNHVMNFGRSGLAETKQWLDAAGVLYFGEPDLSEAERVERVSIRGIPFSFVNWSDWTPVGKPSASNGAGDRDSIIEQIHAEVAAGRIVVVYTHWGDEYAAPLQRVRQLAHSFVDAGASIIIGSHPHIVQESEVYSGKYIYYSLGNFLFDQYWESSVRRGLLLRVEFTPTGVSSVEEIPIDNQTDRRMCAV